MQIHVLSDAAAVAEFAARSIADCARRAVSARGRFLLAVSGGQTPWQMLRALAKQDNVPWGMIYVIQVDERVAPPGDPDRNLTHIHECLRGRVPLPEAQIYAMPVEHDDLESAAIAYSQRLCEIAGAPPVLDLVHLGLGADGHTASLVPGDPVLDNRKQEVAPTGVYQGRRRMTLTYPILDRSRAALWVVTGESKVEMIQRLVDRDESIPAGRVRQDAATLLIADQAAGGRL